MATSSLKLLQPTSKRQRLLRIFAIFALTVAWCVFLDLGAFSPLERLADNLRVTSYAQRHGSFDQWASQQIVLVTRTDDSFEELRGLPLPRSYHAKLVRDLTRAGAKVIALDFTFATPKSEDGELAAAAKASGRVVWAGLLNDKDPDALRWVLPNSKLLAASSFFGHINAPQDELSQVTRVPALKMRGETPIPALSLQIARRALDLQNQPLRRSLGAIHFGFLSIPTDEDGNFRIKYFGTTPKQVFKPIPYETIYGGAVDLPFFRDNHFFRGKIVIIGDTTKGGKDQWPTPLGQMAGSEIQAHAVATLLRGGFFQTAPNWVNWALIFGAAALTCPLVALCRASWAVFGVLLLAIGHVFLNLYLFVDHEIELHLIAPGAAVVLATLGILSERSLTVEREKQRAQALLQRYVSPQIANYVLQNPEKCLLGGVRITATVLFSDIRGFTALSENMAPEAVLERLNEYFEAMTRAVFAHDGTVDKYIGDAIMAIFGAPVPHPDHAHRAVSTALAMQSALLKLQAKWKTEGLPPIEIGIGINTGEMIFGNMGASDRMDFSVLGDAVNLASRVESLNKEMGSRILITAATYELVREEVEVRGPLTAHVKGKSAEVSVYELIGSTIKGKEAKTSLALADFIEKESVGGVER